MIPSINDRWPFVNQSIEKLSNRAEKAQKILLEIAQEDLQKVEMSEEVIDLKKFKSYSSERQENIIFFSKKIKSSIFIFNRDLICLRRALRRLFNI